MINFVCQNVQTLNPQILWVSFHSDLLFWNKIIQVLFYYLIIIFLLALKASV